MRSGEYFRWLAMAMMAASFWMVVPLARAEAPASYRLLRVGVGKYAHTGLQAMPSKGHGGANAVARGDSFSSRVGDLVRVSSPYGNRESRVEAEDHKGRG